MSGDVRLWRGPFDLLMFAADLTAPSLNKRATGHGSSDSTSCCSASWGASPLFLPPPYYKLGLAEPWASLDSTRTE